MSLNRVSATLDTFIARCEENVHFKKAVGELTTTTGKDKKICALALILGSRELEKLMRATVTVATATVAVATATMGLMAFTSNAFKIINTALEKQNRSF